jgi:ribonuclease I
MNDELSNEAVGKRVAADHDDSLSMTEFRSAMRSAFPAEFEKLINLELEVRDCLQHLDHAGSIQPGSALHILLRRAYDLMLPK